MNYDPFINILVRTSNRPNYFKRCIESIKVQSYDNYRVIVSADNKATEDYVKKAGFSPLKVKKTPRTDIATAPWNLYINDLMCKVDQGWILILDDDDILANPLVLDRIARAIRNESHMYVWKMAWPNGRQIPEDEYMGKVPFTRKHIGMPCFTFHSKYLGSGIRFDDQRAGDFRFANRMANTVKKVVFINQIFINIGNTGLVGASKDLKL